MTEQPLISITVDGRPLRAKAGTMLIDVTDAAGIPIPRFCYHKKLSIAANCRMCLVEVEKVPKPLPACATPVSDGMVVHTRSPRAISAQKGTMEFLLINHPLDCPICDQGGECELQDVAMGYGADASRYREAKRIVADRDIGPLIATDLTRCIHCTRCVRFGAEIAGVRELGATGRGEHMTIGTYVERTVDSELSGNVIDLCPVGALTSKPFRFKARSWELIQRDTIAPHDAVGSNLHVHVRGNRVMRVHPRENEAVNEVWISDRDRFSYEGLASPDRLTQPLIKRDGGWQPIDWQAALETAATMLKEAGSGLGALVSPQATVEELYLAQALVSGLGSADIDHRLRQGDNRGDAGDPSFPWLGMALADVERLDAVLVVGSHLRKEQPLIAHRLRKAVLGGGGWRQVTEPKARVSFLNPIDFEWSFPSTQRVAAPDLLVGELAAIAKAAGASGDGKLAGLINGATPGEAHAQIARELKEGARGAVFVGNLAAAHPDYSILRALAAALADATGATLGYLPDGANATGARLAGALPMRGPGGAVRQPDGAAAAAMLADGRKGMLLLNVEPDRDCWDPAAAMRGLNNCDAVVALTPWHTAALEACADLLLPLAPFAETSGTFVNAAGVWQSFTGVVAPLGDTRPGWKVLRVLGNLCGLSGFDYTSSEQVRDELRGLCAELEPDNRPGAIDDVTLHATDAGMLARIGEVPIHAADGLVRRAGALQQTRDAGLAGIRVNGAVATRLGLTDGDSAVVVQNGARVTLGLAIDEAVPDGCARIPAGVAGSEQLGPQFGAVSVEKA